MPTAVCAVCGKESGTGHNVSHSNRKTIRSWSPNLQKIRIKKGNSVVSALVCTRCIKGHKIAKA